jgi:hypothetical protein
MKDRIKIILSILSLTILFLLLREAFFIGYMASDDSKYFEQAMKYLEGDMSLPEKHWGLRYTIVLPLVFLGYITNINEWTLSVIPLIYLILTLLLIYYFSIKKIDLRTFYYLGALIISMPILVSQSTALGVDITEAFFLLAALFSFYNAETSEDNYLSKYFVAGIFLGFALLTRETAYGFLLVLAVFFLMGGYKRWNGYLIGLLGILLILSLEWLYYLSMGEGIFYRFEVALSKHGSIGIKTGDFVSGASGPSGNISDNRLFGPILALLFNQEFALLYWFFLGSIIYFFRNRKTENSTLLKYIFITFLVYFLWTAYSGAIRPLPRYYTFLSILAVFPIVLMLMSVQKTIRYFVIAIIISSNFLALSVENLNPKFAAKTISNYIQESNQNVLTDKNTAHYAKRYLTLYGIDAKLISSTVSNKTGYVYAKVEDAPVNDSYINFVCKENFISKKLPPKILIGKILEWIGIDKFVPEEIYNWLAFRNPPVEYYRINANWSNTCPS